MKKKLLVGLLPALMVLSACGGAIPKDEANYYLEDTLLHEEIFGTLETPSSPIKAVRNLDPVDPISPRIGVQYAEGSKADTTSIRYVAAVYIPKAELASYSAVWTRQIYNADGTKRATAKETIDCTTVYESINDKGTPVDPDDFNPGSTYFVVYTLRNIPNDELGGALLASISVDDSVPGDPVVSKTIATRLETEDNSVRVALAAEDLEIDGYFLKGTINGKTDVIEEDDPTRGPDGTTASFTVDSLVNDSFAVLWNNPDLEAPGFKLLNPTLYGETSLASFTKDNGKIKVLAENHYALYFDVSNNRLSSDVEYIVTFNVTMPSSGIDSLYIMCKFNSWSTNTDKLTEIGTSKVYTTSLRLHAGSYELKLYNGSDEFYGNSRLINISDSDLTYEYTYGLVDFYLIGKIQGETNWADLNPAYKLTKIDGSSTYYELDIDLYNNDSVKLVRDHGNGLLEWRGKYKDGDSEGYNWDIGADGKYTVSFGTDWYSIQINPFDTKSYYLAGSMTGWGDAKDKAQYKLTKIGYYTYQIKNVVVVAGDETKVIDSNGKWYGVGSGDGSNYYFNEAGTYDITFTMGDSNNITATPSSAS